MASTHPTSIHLSPNAKKALRELESDLGLSRSNIIELAVRTLAKKLGFTVKRDRWFPKRRKVQAR